MEFISDFMCFCTHKYGLSPEEIAIVCFVASESIRDIRNEMFLTKSYGYEEDAFPSADRTPVSAKAIYARLNLKRETTRRKLKKLSHRNFIRKVNGGYILPAQLGADDYTKEFRDFIVNKLDILKKYIEKTPE
jgi:DNA-binding MarR family transcriptional regulator